MDYRQEEYKEELEKVHDRDFTHDWVSSSAFLFYLSLATFLAFVVGACIMLYTIRYDKTHPENVVVQGSTKYTPEYKQ